MVVCKFFLQGTCKFGDYCKFEHQINDNFNNYQNSSSILRQSHFGNTQHQQQSKPATNPSNVDTNTLVKSVVNDMTGSEKGGQWLLSCYAPFKEKPAFPGFEDQSFEEIRFGYYEAVKNGTVDQYKQQLQMMLQQAAMRRKSLQTPSPDIVNILRNIYSTPPSSYCGVYGSNTTTTANVFGNTSSTGAFGQQQQSSVFGQQSSSPVFAQPNQNVFGSSPQPQNQFGGTSGNVFAASTPQNPIFKGQTGNSIFGNNQAQPQTAASHFFQPANSSVFGAQQTLSPVQPNTGTIFGGGQPSSNPVFRQSAQPTTSSVFGGQQTNASIFGGQGQQNASPAFGGQTQMQQNNAPAFTSQQQMQQNSGNIFSSNNPAFAQQNMFGSVANQTIGANMPTQTSTNIFAAVQQQNQTSQQPMFAQQQPQSSIFAQQNTGTVFNSQISNSPFGQVSSNIGDAKSHSSSIFGNAQGGVTVNSPFGQQVQQVDETIYSKLEELTEEDIKWFESDDLDIANLPEKPPTYQMCIKT